MAITLNGTSGVTYPAGSTATVAGVGDGQTWQNVLASRARGTNYTNSTGKPIQVCISAQNINSAAMTLTVDGVIAARAWLQGTSGEVNLSAVVPSGAVYRMDNPVTGTIHQWAELR